MDQTKFFDIFLNKFNVDTLLNVFLAIAVDNLTNAEILTHDEEIDLNPEGITRVSYKAKARTFIENLKRDNDLASQNSLNSISHEDIELKPAINVEESNNKEESFQKHGYENGGVLNQLLKPVANGNALETLIVVAPEAKRRNSNLSEHIEDM